MPKLNDDPLTCGRKACDNPVATTEEPIVRIWNMPSHVDGYRDYCLSCGHRIIRYNQTSGDSIQLAWSTDHAQESEPEVQPMPELIGALYPHE